MNGRCGRESARAALEIVDLASPPDDHRRHERIPSCFALGALGRAPPDGVEGRLIVNGQVCAAAPAATDVADLVRSAAVLLEAVGERLQAGDPLITGSVVQVPIEPGDEVIADLGPWADHSSQSGSDPLSRHHSWGQTP